MYILIGKRKEKKRMQIAEINYVDKAEKAIKELCSKTNKNGNKISVVTTSKIRNLLAMVADIYNDVNVNKDEKLSNEIMGRIAYMKLRFYYEAGRENSVKSLFVTAKVLEIIDEIGDSRSNYILFSRYMEALVAFRKYYGGKDD